MNKETKEKMKEIKTKEKLSWWNPFGLSMDAIVVMLFIFITMLWLILK